MTHDFVNPENASFLQGLSEEEWKDLIFRWTEGVPEPMVFADGTMYCDHGREVERRVFVLVHKDDRTVCKGEK